MRTKTSTCPKCGRFGKAHVTRCPYMTGVTAPSSPSPAGASSLAGQTPPAPATTDLYARFKAAHANGLAAGEPAPTLPTSMTSREILEHFGPLDNDRLYWYENGRSSADHSENDEQFWARKTSEARTNTRRDRLPPQGSTERPPVPSEEAPGFHNPSWSSSYPNDRAESLFDDIASHGVLTPVSLQRDPATVGEAGKPEILGGLHRVAVMAAANPDDLIPVAFFDSVSDAQKSLGENY